MKAILCAIVLMASFSIASGLTITTNDFLDDECHGNSYKTFTKEIADVDVCAQDADGTYYKTVCAKSGTFITTGYSDPDCANQDEREPTIAIHGSCTKIGLGNMNYQQVLWTDICVPDMALTITEYSDDFCSQIGDHTEISQVKTYVNVDFGACTEIQQHDDHYSIIVNESTEDENSLHIQEFSDTACATLRYDFETQFGGCHNQKDYLWSGGVPTKDVVLTLETYTSEHCKGIANNTYAETFNLHTCEKFEYFAPYTAHSFIASCSDNGILTFEQYLDDECSNPVPWSIEQIPHGICHNTHEKIADPRDSILDKNAYPFVSPVSQSFMMHIHQGKCQPDVTIDIEHFATDDTNCVEPTVTDFQPISVKLDKCETRAEWEESDIDFVRNTDMAGAWTATKFSCIETNKLQMEKYTDTEDCSGTSETRIVEFGECGQGQMTNHMATWDGQCQNKDVNTTVYSVTYSDASCLVPTQGVVLKDTFIIGNCRSNETHNWIPQCWSGGRITQDYYDNADCSGVSTMNETMEYDQCVPTEDGMYVKDYIKGACEVDGHLTITGFPVDDTACSAVTPIFTATMPFKFNYCNLIPDGIPGFPKSNMIRCLGNGMIGITEFSDQKCEIMIPKENSPLEDRVYNGICVNAGDYNYQLNWNGGCTSSIIIDFYRTPDCFGDSFNTGLMEGIVLDTCMMGDTKDTSSKVVCTELGTLTRTNYHSLDCQEGSEDVSYDLVYGNCDAMPQGDMTFKKPHWKGVCAPEMSLTIVQYGDQYCGALPAPYTSVQDIRAVYNLNIGECVVVNSVIENENDYSIIVNGPDDESKMIKVDIFSGRECKTNKNTQYISHGSCVMNKVWTWEGGVETPSTTVSMKTYTQDNCVGYANNTHIFSFDMLTCQPWTHELPTETGLEKSFFARCMTDGVIQLQTFLNDDCTGAITDPVDKRMYHGRCGDLDEQDWVRRLIKKQEFTSDLAVSFVADIEGVCSPDIALTYSTYSDDNEGCKGEPVDEFPTLPINLDKCTSRPEMEANDPM